MHAIRRRYRLQVAQAGQSYEVAFVLHREDALAAFHHVFLNDVIYGRARGNACELRLHEPEYGHTLQGVTQGQLLVTHDGGIVQEPAYKGQPQSVHRSAAEHGDMHTQYHGEAGAYEQPGEGPAAAGRPQRGQVQIAGYGPDQGAEDATAVQGKTGYEVKEAKQDIHRSQPHEQGGGWIQGGHHLGGVHR